MEKYYSLKEVSTILGISKDTLRYYDRIGIVSPSRADNRYRRYSRSDLIDLMNIQIMQYADITLDEMRRVLGFRKMENIERAYSDEIAAFFDAKYAETRRKIEHLEKVSQLFAKAGETLRDFNNESDQQLAEFVRGIYKDIRKNEPHIMKEDCDEY